MYTANVDTLILEDLLTLSIHQSLWNLSHSVFVLSPVSRSLVPEASHVGVAKKMGASPQSTGRCQHISASPVRFYSVSQAETPFPYLWSRVEALFQLCTVRSRECCVLVLASTCSRIGDASKKWAFIPACISQQ